MFKSVLYVFDDEAVFNCVLEKTTIFYVFKRVLNTNRHISVGN